MTAMLALWVLAVGSLCRSVLHFIVHERARRAAKAWVFPPQITIATRDTILDTF